MILHDDAVVNGRLNALAARPFRRRFQLSGKERSIAEDKGLDVMRRHATDLLSKRLFPAFPHRDGKQTPYKGHPVFIAQHATATCCRTCLMRWHKIPKSRDVTPDEQKYVLSVIETWTVRQLKVDNQSTVM